MKTPSNIFMWFLSTASSIVFSVFFLIFLLWFMITEDTTIGVYCLIFLGAGIQSDVSRIYYTIKMKDDDGK